MKKKFDDYHPEFKSRPSYKQDLKYWITNYKDIDNNEGINQFFSNLSIDIQNDYILKSELYYTKSKEFHTSIGQLPSFESLIVINILADNEFKYQIT